MGKEHRYKATITWTGNSGTGTTSYRAYERSHTIRTDNKPVIEASSDPAFRGDPAKYNPEELLLASVSSCHMLWYLHLCAVEGVVVTDYTDSAEGVMSETNDGAGKFERITLNPIVTVKEESMISKANELHKKANKMCFIANSLNCPVEHKATTLNKG